MCVTANEDVHMLIQGCQLRQVSPAWDGASWAVSCPGFVQGSPGQGRAAARAAVATSARDLRDLGAQAPWRPHGAPTSLGLGDTRSWGAAEGSLGSGDAGGMGTGTMLPPSPCVPFPPLISHKTCRSVRWQRANEPLISHFRDLALLMA